MSKDNGEFIQMSSSADVITARDWTRKLERVEIDRGYGPDEARKLLARRLKTSPGTLENIKRLRTKLLPSWLMNRIRAEFVSVLQSEIQRLEHEIHIARQAGMDNRDDAISAAAAQLAAARKILEG